MGERFPYLAAGAGGARAVLMPLIPLELSVPGVTGVRAQGLIDSGAAVNVLPYGLGVQLGAKWEAQTTTITLTGNLAAAPARAIMLDARVGSLAPVRSAFAWTQLERVPLLLGQVNFFDAFDVCFHRSRRYLEIDVAGS